MGLSGVSVGAMLAQVKKLAGNDLKGRIGAWWDGRDYVASPPAEEGAEGAKAEKPEKPEKPAKEEKPARAEARPEEKPATKEPKPEPVKDATVQEAQARDVEPEPPLEVDAASIRIKALETIWGEGRLAPGSEALDSMMLDAVLEHADKLGGIGFIGPDAALLNAFAGRSDRAAHAAEWRAGCAERLRALAPRAVIETCDLDRPRGFGDHTLEGVVSCEAFAFADHKAGLAHRVCRSLTEHGRWVFLDTTRNTTKTPPEAFASAWAEPQLLTNDDVWEYLQHAGFGSIKKESVTELVLSAAREGYERLGKALEEAAAQGLDGREGALFLQELAWEAQSWRARVRALEGGALEVNLWVADRGQPLDLTRRIMSGNAVAVGEKPGEAAAAPASN
jgi:hypothetical protein